MKTINNILAGALLIFSSALFAQQESIFTMYRYHMNIINPAYAGVDNETVLTSTIRSQWTGIKDAPETQAVSFGTQAGNNLGIGLSMVNDKTFIERQTTLGIDFSYRLKLGITTDLYLGIKAGGNFYDVNTSGLQTYMTQSDPNLESINQFNPNIGVGILLKDENLFISLSVPRILNTERAKNEEGYTSVTTDKAHVYLSGGYDFNLNSMKSLALKPSFMLRYVNDIPVSLDFNTMLQFQNNFEIGTTYRNDKTFAGLVDFTIGRRLMIGYVY